MMLFVVTLISLLVHVYSTELPARRPPLHPLLRAPQPVHRVDAAARRGRQHAQLLVGWELVGLCSFVLIGHWWEEKPNSDAAVKAFLTTRTGDVGLMIGVIILFFAAGSVRHRARSTPEALNGGIGHTLLVVARPACSSAIIGKSGQFPLHTWLPDAMAGPDARVGAHPRRHDGRRRRLPRSPASIRVFFRGFSIGAGGTQRRWRSSAASRSSSARCSRSCRHDIKKVLAYSTDQPARLHGDGARRRAPGWRRSSTCSPTRSSRRCLFLGAGSVSQSGSHHSFDMKKRHGRPAQVHADHLLRRS